MTKLSLSGTVKLASGETHSFTVSEGASSIVIRLNSLEGVVGCLTVESDKDGRPFIRLKMERGIDIIVSGFRQFRVSDIVEETTR